MIFWIMRAAPIRAPKRRARRDDGASVNSERLAHQAGENIGSRKIQQGRR
jgi:hypothetical protein